MANNNETTTKFKVDISELKKAMQEAKRSIAVANSEFKAVSSSMDDWSKSTDGINAKLKQLDTTMSAQKTVLSNLEAQYEAVKEEQGENSKAADDLLIKINNQKAAINKTEKEISNYQATLGEVSEAEKKAAKSGKDVSDVLDEMKNEAKDAGDGFTVLKGTMAEFAGNVVTGLANSLKDAVVSLFNLAGETREYRTELGKLETAFTSAGHSSETATKTYKDLYAVLGDEGQATEAASHLAKLTKSQEDLAKWTNIATGVYGTFGDSLPIEGLTEAANETAKTGTLTGALADSLNWAGVSEDKFQAQLDKCSSEQERQALITETLNGLYSEAADKYKEVNGDIMDAQRAQSELSDTTAELGKKIEPVTTAVKKGFNDVLQKVLELVQDVDMGAFTSKIEEAFKVLTNDVLPVVKDGLGWILDNKDAIITGLASIAAGFVAFKVVSIIQGLVTAFTAWRAATEGMTIAQAALNTVMSLNPVGLIIAAIAALVVAFITLWKNSDAFREFWINLWEKIKSGTKAAVDTIGKFFTETIPNFFKSVISWIKANWSTILVFLISPFAGLFKYFYENNSKFKEFVDNAISFIKQLPVKIAQLLGQAIGAVINWTANMIANAKEAGSNFLKNAINFIKQLPSNIATWLTNTLTKVASWASNLAKKGKEAAKSLKDSVVAGLKELPSKMLEIGKNIVSGVWNGIKNAKAQFTKNVKNFFSGIVDGAKDVLDIHSPSRVFEKTVGENIALGVIKGMQNKYKKVKMTAAELAMITYETAKEKLDTYKKYNDMSLANELAYWKKIVNTTKKGTQGYKDALLEYRKVRDSINEQIKKAEDDYANKVSSVKTKLIADIQAVTDKYDNAVKSRAESIANSMGLFDEFSSTTEKSATDLLNNLEGQVNAIYEWDEALRTLSARGVGDGLVTQLQNMGVSALADIKTLVAMTDEELTKYVALWDIKNQLATDRAVEEYRTLREQSQVEIQELIKTANADLNALEKDYKASLLELGVTTKDTSVTIGKGIVQGMKEGISSQREELMSYVNDLCNSIVSSAKNALSYVAALSGGAGASISSLDTSGVSSVANSLSSSTGSSSGAVGASTVVNNFNQTINSPQALTRLEIYRQSKNLLAFNGGA